MSELGSRVKLHCRDEYIEGVVVPSENPDYVVVKLDSGYNIGVSRDKVKKIETLKKNKQSSKPTHKKVKKDPKKVNISILHTGGTIASRVDYSTGAVINKFEPEEILAMFPKLHDIANIESRLIGNVSSEMMRFDHYNIIAKEIEKEAKNVDGIIITHGTDTMHYTSAALSFILENLNIPVVLVGSQRSSDRPSTDARFNLLSAASFIAKTDFAGVAICMHEHTSDDSCLILHGCKARKMHTSRRDAFKPVNHPPIARVGVKNKEIEFFNGYTKRDKDAEKLSLKLFNPKLKIGMVKMHPNMFADELSAYDKFDGLVLELYALGHAPTMVQDKNMKENEKISDRIRKLCGRMPIVGASQCIYGRIDMDVYTPGRDLKDMGVLGNNLDMTPETAFIKLAWLLSNFKKDEVSQLYDKNLRGEINLRITERDH